MKILGKMPQVMLMTTQLAARWLSIFYGGLQCDCNRYDKKQQAVYADLKAIEEIDVMGYQQWKIQQCSLLSKNPTKLSWISQKKL